MRAVLVAVAWADILLCAAGRALCVAVPALAVGIISVAWLRRLRHRTRYRR